MRDRFRCSSHMPVLLLVILLWAAVALGVICIVGCASPLAPEPVMVETPVVPSPPWTYTAPLCSCSSAKPPSNSWFAGGFVCGFPQEPVCRFFPGYRWETREAYCADHQDSKNCY